MHIKTTKDGGTGLLHKKLDIKPQRTEHFWYFDQSVMLLKASPSNWIRISVIYCPGPNTKIKFTVDIFLNEFQTMLERLMLIPDELVI